MPAPQPSRTIRMQIVELPPPAATPPPTTQTAPLRNVAPPPATVRAAHAPAPARAAAPVKLPDTLPSRDALPAHRPVPSPDAEHARASSDETRPASATQAEAATTHTSAAGHAQARLISQPLPTLPDDLREEGYQAVAVARFLIHTDGTFDIDLVRPTSNPRLNQILLDALHRWRFFPAMENGRPVESRQDVRVHFNVD